MKNFLFLGGLLVSSTAVFGAPCLPGTLQEYVNLGGGGCQLGAAQFSGFMTVAGQTIATPIDPGVISVSPGGTLLMPNLLFTLNTAASAGQVFESFFRFNVTGLLAGSATIALTSPSATADGAVTGVLDVCPGGSFSADAPLGCPTSPATAIAFATAQAASLSEVAVFPTSGFFDVFVDLTVDGGGSGSAFLDSASVAFTAVPEPYAAHLIAVGIGILGALRARRAL